MATPAAGLLQETVALHLPGPTVPDGRLGRKPVGSGLVYNRAARVRVLRAGEKTRYGLTLNTQAWQVTVRATHPLKDDPFGQAMTGQLQWREEQGNVVSVEPSEDRASWTLLVTNQTGS